MINNFHVLVVHFPIALLTLYVVLEFLSLSKRLKGYSLDVTKAILVITGTLGAIVSRMTGESVDHALRDQAIKSTGLLPQELWRPVLELHEGASLWATVFFLIIAIGYILYFFETSTKIKNTPVYVNLKKTMHTQIKKFIWMFTRPYMRVILAVLGLIFITLTGAFGGILVHGCESDILTQVLCNTMLGQ